MPLFENPPRRFVRLIVVALLVASVGMLARSLATLPSKRAMQHAASGPFDWRRISAPVAALERLVAAHDDRLERGTPVLVVARAPDDADASFVWHWAQYLAPRANFVWIGDVGPAAPSELLLTWNAPPTPGAWRELGREADFALFEALP